MILDWFQTLHKATPTGNPTGGELYACNEEAQVILAYTINNIHCQTTQTMQSQVATMLLGWCKSRRRGFAHSTVLILEGEDWVAPLPSRLTVELWINACLYSNIVTLCYMYRNVSICEVIRKRCCNQKHCSFVVNKHQLECLQMQHTHFAWLVDHAMLYFWGEIFKTKLATNCKKLDIFEDFSPHGKHVLEDRIGVIGHCSYEYVPYLPRTHPRLHNTSMVV